MVKRLKAMQTRPPSISAAFVNRGQKKFKEKDGSTRFEDYEERIPGHDDRTILKIPQGISGSVLADAIGWFTARGGIREDLGSMQAKNGEIKLSKVLTPEPTQEQLIQIISDYKLLSPHYPCWARVAFKQERSQGDQEID